MAELGYRQIQRDSEAELVVLYQVAPVSENDFIDVSAEFSKVKAASWVGAGNASPLQGTPTISAYTTLTFDEATLDKDTLFVTVVGNIIAPEPPPEPE